MLSICEIWLAEKFAVRAASLANTESGWNKTKWKTIIEIEEKFNKEGIYGKLRKSRKSNI